MSLSLSLYIALYFSTAPIFVHRTRTYSNIDIPNGILFAFFGATRGVCVSVILFDFRMDGNDRNYVLVYMR